MSVRGASHLHRQGGRYYCRRAVPQDLIDHYGGKKELKRSLGTSDPAEARRLLPIVDASLQQEFDLARGHTPGLIRGRVHAVPMPAHAGPKVQPALAPKADWLPALIAQVVAETKREMLGYGKTEPAPTASPAPAPTTAEPEPTLRTVLPLYLRERQPRPRTAQEITSIVARFGEDWKLVKWTPILGPVA